MTLAPAVGLLFYYYSEKNHFGELAFREIFFRNPKRKIHHPLMELGWHLPTQTLLMSKPDRKMIVQVRLDKDFKGKKIIEILVYT